MMIDDENKSKEGKIIETIAPIPLDHIKQYFEDKETFFIIDYDKSTLDKERFLTYLSNLDIPCDIVIRSDEKFIEIYSAYLKFNQLVTIPLLEEITINFLLERRHLRPGHFPQYLKMWEEEFIHWEERLDSLPLYSIYTLNIPQAKVYVQNHERDETDTTEGINFVSLLKHPRFFHYYCAKGNPKYFVKYFNEYMFNGNNLFHYWATPHNFAFNFLISLTSGKLDPDDFGEILTAQFLHALDVDDEYHEELKEKNLKKETTIL